MLKWCNDQNWCQKHVGHLYMGGTFFLIQLCWWGTFVSTWPSTHLSVDRNMSAQYRPCEAVPHAWMALLTWKMGINWYDVVSLYALVLLPHPWHWPWIFRVKFRNSSVSRPDESNSFEFMNIISVNSDAKRTEIYMFQSSGSYTRLLCSQHDLVNNSKFYYMSKVCNFINIYIVVCEVKPTFPYFCNIKYIVKMKIHSHHYNQKN